MKETKRRSGRPTRADREGEKAAISFRTSKTLVDQIKAEASKAGRNMSEEVELRLAASLQRTHLLDETLALALGARGAELARDLIDGISGTRTLLGVLKLGTTEVVLNPEAPWSDPWCWAEMKEAIDRIIDHGAPPGEPIPPKPKKLDEIIGTDREEAERTYQMVNEHPGVIVANGIIRRRAK
jgi:hypothetical protein